MPAVPRRRPVAGSPKTHRDRSAPIADLPRRICSEPPTRYIPPLPKATATSDTPHCHLPLQ